MNKIFDGRQIEYYSMLRTVICILIFDSHRHSETESRDAGITNFSIPNPEIEIQSRDCSH